MLLHRVRAATRGSDVVNRQRVATRRDVSFLCPRCSQPLALHPPADSRSSARGASLRCEAGHSIDVAKEGHVNLIPSGRRPPKVPKVRGDADVAVRARRAFFERGHYRKQVQAVARAVGAALLDTSSDKGSDRCQAPILDVGCGEGRYLRELEQQLGDRVQLWGTDLSKLAVRYAAKRQTAASFAVAASHRLPFDDSQFDVVLSVFAPLALAEFFRVLRPNGALVVAQGGPHHLDALRAAVCEGREPLAAARADRLSDPHTPQLPEPVATMRATSFHKFEAEDAKLLLAMTPYYWVASSELQNGIAEDAPLKTAVDFVITTYRKETG